LTHKNHWKKLLSTLSTTCSVSSMTSTSLPKAIICLASYVPYIVG
jgi:hypothetical protein